MLVRWLAASWRLNEAEAALDTILLEKDKLTGTNTVARAYLSADLLDQAIILFVHNLTDYERILGPDHPNTLATRNNLASVHILFLFVLLSFFYRSFLSLLYNHVMKNTTRSEERL